MKKSHIKRSAVLLLVFSFAFSSVFAEPPKPPKKLKAEKVSDTRINLSWERDPNEVNEPILFKVYQKFTPYGNFSSYNNSSSSTQADYSDQPGFQRVGSKNQYRLLFEIPSIVGTGGSGSIKSGTLSAAWDFNESVITSKIMGQLPESKGIDERNRPSYGRGYEDFIFKVVPVHGQTQERGLGSSEAEGRRKTLLPEPVFDSATTLPPPTDVTLTTGASGTALKWFAQVPSDYPFPEVDYKVTKAQWNPSLQDYVFNNTITVMRVPAPIAAASYDFNIPSWNISSAHHEYSSYPSGGAEPKGVYKVSIHPVYVSYIHYTTAYAVSPYSPESRTTAA